MYSSIPFKATTLLPGFHNSNQRVVVLVAADGLIMISENFKSSKPAPFTTLVICHPKKSNLIKKKRVIVLYVVDVICRLKTKRMDRVVRVCRWKGAKNRPNEIVNDGGDVVSIILCSPAC
jgi:hypothetical protein